LSFEKWVEVVGNPSLCPAVPIFEVAVTIVEVVVLLHSVVHEFAVIIQKKYGDGQWLSYNGQIRVD
jgi:hypothetical protein